MASSILKTGIVMCLLTFTSAAFAPLPARASIAGAIIAVTDGSGSTIYSTSVTTMAIVTKGWRNGKKSYIECYFQTAGGQVGLHLESKDQRRVEALYQQIVTAAAGGHSFQVTAYWSSMYQSNGYTANLDSDLVYLILY